MTQDNTDPSWIGGVDESDIYKENILDHYKHPHNYGTLHNPDITHTGINPSCGDTLHVTLQFNHDTIQDIMFTGKGCAISIAAMSMLTEHLKGKPLKEVHALTQHTITELLGIKLGVVRIKCATLGLHTIREALHTRKTP